MNFATKLGAGLASLMIGTMALTVTPAAIADTGALSPSEEKAIRANMSDGGIDVPTQDILIERINSGDTPDSMSGAVPVKTTTSVVSGNVRTTRVFSDGSRSWVELEKPAHGLLSKRSTIDNCTKSGKWMVGCRVGVYDLISSAVFVIDYQANGSGGSIVRDMRSKNCTNLAGTCSVSGGIKRATQSSAGPAWAELTYEATAGPVNVSGAFGVRVSGSHVTTY